MAETIEPIEEELEEPLKVVEPSEALPITPVERTKTSNVDDDLKVHLTKTQLTDLTDAGATILHKHDHGGMDGLTDDDHDFYHNNARADARYLYRENTGAFTPNADYEPATKKYVDDNLPTGVVQVLLNDMTGGSETITAGGDVEIVSYTLPGGTLGANGAIRIRAQIRTDATAWAGEIDLQLAGVDISGEAASKTIVRVTGDNSEKWEIDCIMKNTNDEEAQKIAGSILQADGSNVIFTDTKTADTSGDIAISIDGKRDTGSESGILSVVHWMIELLPAP